MKPMSFLLSTALSCTPPALAFSGQDTFPVVDRLTQEARDATRRQILEAELATEQHELDNARRLITDATGNGQAVNKLQTLRENAARHASNIDALHGELAAIARLPDTVRRQPPARMPARATANSRDRALAIPYWDVYRRALPQAEGNPAVTPASGASLRQADNRPEQ